MLEKQVTARVIKESHLREERSKVDQVIILPGSFVITNPVTGEPFACKFKDENGIPAVQFAISTQKAFDLTNKNDKHNFETVKLFLLANPEYANVIQLHDPEEESTKEERMLQLSLDISTKIAEMSDNTDWMAKLYRILVGYASGITEQKIRVEMLKMARNEPQKFVAASGSLIYEDETFETLSLVNIALERGVLSRDKDGYIHTKAGHIYADNIQKAAFALASDVELQELIKYEVSGKKQIEPTTFVPKAEQSDLVKLMENVGERVQTDSFNSDGTLDADGNDELLEIAMGENIQKLIAGNFIEEGKGPAGKPRFKVHGFPNKFKMEELAGFFKTNTTVYKGLLDRAKLK